MRSRVRAPPSPPQEKTTPCGWFFLFDGGGENPPGGRDATVYFGEAEMAEPPRLHRLRGPPPSSEGGGGRSPLTQTNERATPFPPIMRLRSHARVILSGACTRDASAAESNCVAVRGVSRAGSRAWVRDNDFFSNDAAIAFQPSCFPFVSVFCAL